MIQLNDLLLNDYTSQNATDRYYFEFKIIKHTQEHKPETKKQKI